MCMSICLCIYHIYIYTYHVCSRTSAKHHTLEHPCNQWQGSAPRPSPAPAAAAAPSPRRPGPRPGAAAARAFCIWFCALYD